MIKVEKSMMTKMIGSAIASKYQIIKQLGDKVASNTYLVEDQTTPNSTFYVLKQIKFDNDSIISYEEAKNLVEIEVEKFKKLIPNLGISQLLDYFEDEGSFYLIQEFKQGISLAEKLATQKLWKESDVIQFLQQSLYILDLIHSQGIIHQDLKPANIIYSENQEQLVLVDFGKISKLVNNLQATIPIENRAYFSNELLRGKPQPASDIYALGMIAIQALTGVNPIEFNEDNNGHIIWEQEIEISEKLRDILNKMIAPLLNQRYASAQEILQELVSLLPANLTEEGEYTPTEIIESEPLLSSIENSPNLEENLLNQNELITHSHAEIFDPWLDNNNNNQETEVNENQNSTIKNNNQSSLPVTEFVEPIEQINPDFILPLKTESPSQPTIVLPVENSLNSTHKNQRKLAFNIWRRTNNPFLFGTFSLFLLIFLAIASVNSFKEKRKETFLAKIESFIKDKDYQSCLNQTSSGEGENLGILNEVLQEYQGQCMLNSAREEASNRQFTEAIAIALKINTNNPYYQQAQNSIDGWAKAILEIATQTYERGNSEKALEILRTIPQSSFVKKEAINLERKWLQEQNRQIIEQKKPLDF